MGFWKSISGTLRIEIISSDISRTLSAIQDNDITLSDILFVDALHMQANISGRELSALQLMLCKRGEDIKILKERGIYWSLIRIKKRPVILFGMLVILFSSLFLPTRVLFVQVEGNQTVADRTIIETANTCGIRFFASRREVRSEKIKNSLLHALPALQWAGVNTKGCVAVISVKERKEEPDNATLPRVGNIVSLQDGIVEEMTVLSGTPLCKVGQGVKKGQVLISGYTDCGLLIKVQRAAGEVIGQTFRELEAVTPTQFVKRGAHIRKKTKIMLRIGKNIINFSKDSGISDTECVKMYEEKFLTLPGGFSLPIALINQTCIYTEYNRANNSDGDFSWLEETCEEYLKSIMIAGDILQKKQIGICDDGIYTIKGKYACKELIGQIRYEENISSYGT